MSSPDHLDQAAPRAHSDIRELARGGSITFLGGVGGAVCTFAMLVVVARYLGSSAAGLFFQAVALASTCAIAAAWGAGTTLAPRLAAQLARRERDVSDLAWSATGPVAIVGLVMAVLIAGLHGPLAAAMTHAPTDRHDLGLTLLAIAPAVPSIALIRLVNSIARGTGALGPTALYDSGGQPLLRLVLCGLVALRHGPLWLAGLAFTAAALVSLVATLVHTRRSVSRAGATLHRPHGWPSRSARGFWAYSLPRGLEELFQVTNTWLLVVLVGALASPTDAATYSAISRFTLASTLLMQAITTAMATRFTAAFVRQETARFRALFRAAVTWTVGLSVPVAATMWIYPQALIHLVSPQLSDADAGLRLMAVATLFSMVTGPSGAVILFSGRSSWNLMIALPSVALMLTLAFMTIPGHGANGACFAWGASIGLQSVIGYVVARTAFGLDPLCWPVLRLAAWSALLTIPVEVLSVMLLGDTVGALVVGIAVGTALFLGANTVLSWRLWGQAPA